MIPMVQKDTKDSKDLMESKDSKDPKDFDHFLGFKRSKDSMALQDFEGQRTPSVLRFPRILSILRIQKVL